MDRVDVLKSMFDPEGSGLEVGPSYNPIVSKSSGYRIKHADHASARDLEKKYGLKSDSVDAVDFVTNGQSLLETIGAEEKFDYVIASHMIEHAPDLIGFLKDCSAVLKHSGVLVLAVPDKRHCFDLFRGVSTVGEVMQAHLEKRTRHPPGKHFDHHANAVTREGHIVWPMGFGGEIQHVHTLAEADAAMAKAATSLDYLDCHAWFFTPSSFRLIVSDLYEIDQVDLRESCFIDSTGPEFYISLSREGSGPSVSRSTLNKNTILELRSVPLSD